jgi:CRP-like cAMP-binding protein
VNVLLGCKVNLNRVIVQVAMTGARIKAGILLRLYDDSARELRATGNRYIQYRLNQVSQSAICNHAHEIEERLARWLLTTADTVGQDQFDLTHEFLSQMLGARRSSVTLAAGSLATAGVIEYHRGRILILKRGALQDLACECYFTLKRELAAVNES